MFRWFQIIVFAFVYMYPVFSVAQENGGNVILNPQQLPDEKKLPDYGKIANDYIQDVMFYDQKYPGIKIEEDFIDDIKEKHPDYSMQNASLNERFIRYGVRGVRFYNRFKDSVNGFLLENDLPVYFENEEFADEADWNYQESDNAVVVTDFKKIVPYSKNERDRKAVYNKISEEISGKSLFQHKSEMKEALLKGDWKKVFTYGLFDWKVLDDKLGIGEWENNDYVQIRILSVQTAVGTSGKITGAVQVFIRDGKFLLLDRFKQYKELQLSLDNSDNIRAVSQNRPVPIRISKGKIDTLVGYLGNVVFPFSLEVDNIEKPVLLKAVLSGTVCGEKNCDSFEVKTELSLNKGPAEDSEAASYLRVADTYIPKEENKKLEIQEAFIENNATPGIQPILRVEFRSKESVSDFDIFIRDTDWTEFEQPLITINGKQVTARFKTVKTGLDLSGHSFEIVAQANQSSIVHHLTNVQKASVLDAANGRLTLNMIGWALFGGFLLNIMPCVFPFWGLKIISLSGFGVKDRTEVRRGFLLNTLGIILGFGILTGLLSVLKISGMTMVWGMPFQNIYLLSMMIFIIAGFWACVWEICSFSEKISSIFSTSGTIKCIFSGFLIVLLSVFCANPYLGEPVSFALNGSIKEFMAVISAVLLGMSLPYIFFAIFPGFVYLVPIPGKWIKYVRLIINTMLGLALVWLLNILYIQTSGVQIIQIILFILIFWGILWFHKLLIQITDQQSASDDVLQKTKTFFNTIALLLVGIVFVWALISSQNAYKAGHKEKLSVREADGDIYQDIQEQVKQGKIVLLKVEADWCLLCKFNNAVIFDDEQIKDILSEKDVKIFEVDWTGYDEKTLALMKNFGRYNLPFYVIFSPRIPSGIVLPVQIGKLDFRNMLEHSSY